jgi:hypothetical protein
MSERWQGSTGDEYQQQPVDLSGHELDMAARYASQLRELHEKCQDDSKFYMKILGYSDITVTQGKYILNPTSSSSSPSLPRTGLAPIPPSPSKQSTRPSSTNTYGYTENSTFYQQRMLGSPNEPSTYNSGLSDSMSAATNHSRLYRAQQLNTHSPFANISTPYIGSNGHEHVVSGDLRAVNGDDEIVQDELSVMSQVLLGQPFLELDRVITLEGTDFDFEANNWGNIS